MSMEHFSELDNDSLRAVLLQNGVDAGPVTDMTRKVYLNKLARIMKDKQPETGTNGGSSHEAGGESYTLKAAETKVPDASASSDSIRTSPQKSSTPSKAAKERQAKQQKLVDALNRASSHQEVAHHRTTEFASERAGTSHAAGVSDSRGFSRDILQTPAKESFLTETERQALRIRLSNSVKPRRPIDSFFYDSPVNKPAVNKPTQMQRTAPRRIRGMGFCGLSTCHLVVLTFLFILSCFGIAYFYIGGLQPRRKN